MPRGWQPAFAFRGVDSGGKVLKLILYDVIMRVMNANFMKLGDVWRV